MNSAAPASATTQREDMSAGSMSPAARMVNPVNRNHSPSRMRVTRSVAPGQARATTPDVAAGNARGILHHLPSCFSKNAASACMAP